MKLYRGYFNLAGKTPRMKWKRENVPDEALLTLKQARCYPEYGAPLTEEVALVDIDDHDQAEKLLDIVRDLALNCRVIRTDRGLHFLFNNKEKRLRKCVSGVRFAVGLAGDVKVGLTNAYEKLKAHGEERPCIYGQDLTDTDQLSPVPEWLQVIGKAKDTVNFPEMHDHDGRNSALFSHSFNLQKRGFTKEAVRETCRLIGSYVFAEKIEDNELDLILRDESLNVEPEFSDEEEGGKSFAWKLKFHRMAQSGRPIDVVDTKIVRHVLENNTVIVIEGEAYIYQDGVFRYDRNGVQIKAKIRECMFDEVETIHRIDRVYKLLLSEESLQHNSDDLNRHPRSWINCRSGMLDLKTLELHEHRPEYFSLNQIPFSYSPDYSLPAESITIDFLDAILPDKEDREMFLEYAGYCLSTYTGFQKYLILSGKGGIGKSVLVKMINRAVGEENMISISLQALAGRFSTRFLYGKLLNSCADLSSAAMTDTGPLKMIVGEDQVPAEIKGGASFCFRPYAKLLFSANRIPTSRDEQSNAFYRRLMILHIDKRCREFPDLEERLEADAEVFFYLAIWSAHEAFRRGKLTESARSRAEVLELYLRTDTVKAFLHYRTEKDKASRIRTASAYDEYLRYCEETDRPYLSRNGFRANLLEKGFSVKTVHGVEYFDGLRIAGPDYEPGAVDWDSLE